MVPDHPLKHSLADRYTLEGELGRGGMATVYEALDLRHGRSVALKVLHAPAASSALAERFGLEVRTAGRLQHPHIVPVFDSGVTGEFLWYTMPLVRGESLAARLAREGALPLDAVLITARQIADALAAAHAEGIVHRDVKPANILLTQEHALLTDFGIARALAPTGGERLTESGTVVGTPAYMSPEQIGGGALDGRSDQYSLACVVYEMLSGEAPFTGPTPQAAIARRFAEAPRPIRSVRPQVPVAVEAAVQRALALTPADRHPTVAAFAAALQAGMQESQAPRSRRQARALGLGAAVLAATALAVIQLRPDDRQADADEPLRLAVLPFLHHGPDSLAYFADGLTEAVAQQLAQVGSLAVIDPQSASQYSGTERPLKTIGSELGITHVVRGSVRWDIASDAPMLQITPSLVRIQDGQTIWAGKPIVSRWDEMFRLQADIATAVAGGLALSLTAVDQTRLATHSTDNPRAYDLYLRAQAASDEADRAGAVGAGNHERAVRLYREALALDPTFAMAQAELGRILLRDFWYAGDSVQLREGVARIDTAQTLRPDLPAVTAAHALALYAEGRHAEAERVSVEAVAAHPRSAPALNTLGNIRQDQNRYAEALDLYERAVAADPKSLAQLKAAANAAFRLSRYDLATHYTDRVRAIDPTDPSILDHELALGFARGDDDAVLRAIDAMEASGEATIYSYFGMGHLGPELQRRVLGVPLERFPDASVFDSANYYGMKFWAAASEGSEPLLLAYADSLERVHDHMPPSEVTRIFARAMHAMVAAARLDRSEAPAAIEATKPDTTSSDAARRQGVLWAFEEAWLYQRIGETDSAVAALRRGFKSNQGLMTRDFLRAAASLESLRRTPAMQELLADSRLP